MNDLLCRPLAASVQGALIQILGGSEGAVNTTEQEMVIIGGGQSAKGLLFALAERCARGDKSLKGMRITVLEQSDEFGTGLAWSRRFALDHHLSSLAEPSSRVSYGDTQQKQFHGSVQLLKEFGVPVTLRQEEEAVQLSRAENHYKIRLACGLTVCAPFVILAIGYAKKNDPHQGKKGYHASPWPARTLQEAVLRGDTSKNQAKRRILILGTYLNAVDAVLTLAHGFGAFTRDTAGRLHFTPLREHQLVMASRYGMLPTVWGAAPPPRTMRCFNPQNLKDQARSHGGLLPLQQALDLLRQEMTDVDPNAARFLAGSVTMCARRLRRWAARGGALASLQRHIRAVVHDNSLSGSYGTARRVPWQSVLFNALPTLSEYSHLFSAEDQLSFDTSLRTLYFHFTMPLGLENAMRLEALICAGVLNVIALGEDYRLCWESSPDNEETQRISLTAENGRSWDFTDVVNAASRFAGLAHSRSPFLRNLWETGLIQDSQRSFAGAETSGSKLSTHGIYVNPATCEAIPKGCSEPEYHAQGPTLYAMGPALVGQFIDAQSIGQIERDARRILNDVTQKIPKQV